MTNRSRIEIIGRVLKTINEKNGCSSMTQIMYKAFLGFAQTKEYVTDLTKSGFLIYDSPSHTFKTTEKGLRFLQIYDQIDEMIGLSQEQPLKTWI